MFQTFYQLGLSINFCYNFTPNTPSFAPSLLLVLLYLYGVKVDLKFHSQKGFCIFQLLQEHVKVWFLALPLPLLYSIHGDSLPGL